MPIQMLNTKCAVGAVPVSLRAFVPEAVLDLGLVVLAAGIAWLSAWLFAQSSRIAPLTFPQPVAIRVNAASPPVTTLS